LADFGPGFQSAVKSAYPGWSVVRHTATSKIRLRVRSGERCVGEQAVLPLAWEARNVAEAMQWIGRIYKLIHTGDHSLKTARDAVLGKATTHVEKKDWTWDQICEKYRNHLQTRKNKIKDTTFEASYGRYFEVMLKLLRSNTPPRTGAQLLDAVLSAPRVNKKPGKMFGTPLKTWGEQDASRLECCLAIKNMLTYAVSMDYRPGLWLIPEALYEDLRGSDGAAAAVKGKSDLTDIEILELIQAIEQRSPGWASVLRLCATFGLRPCEADRNRHLEVRVNSRGQEQLHCSYQKKAGKRFTPQRWLVPLPFIDHGGEKVWWDGWRSLNDLPWPPVERVDGAALGKFLRRQPEWKSLVAEKAKQGLQLKPYAFRDSFTHRCARFGIADADAALASGHSVKVHRESYINTSTETMLDAFDRAAGRN
jgi:hypothetical protein